MLRERVEKVADRKRLDRLAAERADCLLHRERGACDATSPFYYRVYNPVLLIEFDHQPGIALDNDFPSRHHTHTLMRTPNGNDYGKDLLRQHYRQFDHSRADTPHRMGKA